MSDADQLGPVEVRVVELVTCTLNPVYLQDLALTCRARVCEVVPQIVVAGSASGVAWSFPGADLWHAVFQPDVSVMSSRTEFFVIDS